MSPVSSAIMGHSFHRLCGGHPGPHLLLLCLQKVDIQEEEQKEGQRQGQERHQHDGCHRRGKDRGTVFELLPTSTFKTHLQFFRLK